ncbi:MAG: alkyl sulfatase BDS1-like metallo-beta-lactamase superfamily hydrolase [Candidatus Azotimanducaceae bacterium]|jgi:alkyl sulfatase BDS1-like metallo-beta-lactamase superfamily hydrolase
MADLFALSDNILNSDTSSDKPFGRVNHELSELDNGLSFVEAFSNSVNFSTDEGLVIVDTSSVRGGQRVVDAIEHWRPEDRFNSLIYTHGHVDHVGGSGAFIASAAENKKPNIEIYGHENVSDRFSRYDLTNGYNQIINHRQFGTELSGSFLPEDAGAPTVTYQKYLNIQKGDVEFELHYAKGETDDHTWIWVPKYKAICAGDFFIWNFPNAGNPQKVQRFPLEWAAAMRAMAAKKPEYFLPAHGLPIRGADQITKVLNNCAFVLEHLVKETLSMMNNGARKNEIIHTVKVDQKLLDLPYLRPLYDEPEFVINNIWRLYGGWYDGNPANLKPAPESSLATEIANLAGGSLNLGNRAMEIADKNDYRLACHLIEYAVNADPSNKLLHSMRSKIYRSRIAEESSLMSKGIFGHASKESKKISDS